MDTKEQIVTADNFWDFMSRVDGYDFPDSRAEYGNSVNEEDK